MDARRWVVVAMTVSVLAFVTGCAPTGGQDDAPDPAPASESASPSPSSEGTALTEEESAELKAILDTVEGTDSFDVVSQIESSAVRQSIVLTVDAASSAFEGTIETDGEGASARMEVIRAHELTWLRASPEFWVSQGYTSDGAAMTEGLYVVFEKTAGDRIAAQFDPLPLIEHVRDADPEQAVRTVDGFALDDGIVIGAGDDGSVEVSRTSDDATASVVLAPRADPADIAPPARDETLPVDAAD